MCLQGEGYVYLQTARATHLLPTPLLTRREKILAPFRNASRTRAGSTLFACRFIVESKTEGECSGMSVDAQDKVLRPEPHELDSGWKVLRSCPSV
eukprot:270296-Amphidinium_carterae.2